MATEAAAHNDEHPDAEDEQLPPLVFDGDVCTMRPAASDMIRISPRSMAYRQAFRNHGTALGDIGGDVEDVVDGVFIPEYDTRDGGADVDADEQAVRELIEQEERELASLVGGMTLGEGNAGDHIAEAPADAQHNRMVSAVADETNALVERLGEMAVAEVAAQTGVATEQVEPMHEYEKWVALMEYPEQQQREKAMFEQLAVRFGPDEARAFMYDPDYVLWCMRSDMIDPASQMPVRSWIHLGEYLTECHTFENAPCEYHHYEWPGVRGLRTAAADDGDGDEEDTAAVFAKKKPQPAEPLTSVIGMSRRGTAVVIVDRTRLAALVYRRGEPTWQALDGYELPVDEWGAPECRNIDRDVVSLLFKRGDTTRIDVLVIPSGAPHDRTLISRSFYVAGVNVVYAIANNMWLMMVTADGRWAGWSVSDDSFRTPFEQLTITTRATPKVDPSAQQPMVNPCSETPLPMEPEEPALRTRVMHVMCAFFDDLDGCAFVISTNSAGSCFRGRLPTLTVDSSEEHKAELRSKMRLQFMLSPSEIKMGTDSSKLAPGQPVPVKPTREPAINMCMRSVMGDNPDFSIAQASASSISYMSKSAAFDRQFRPDLASRRAVYQATDQEQPCNCVAVLGTLLVAHSSNGEVLIFSMLSTPHGQNALCKSFADPNIPAVSDFYPSLCVRSRHISCLMPDGSLLVFKAALRTVTKASKARMVTAGNAHLTGTGGEQSHKTNDEADKRAEEAEILAAIKAQNETAEQQPEQ